MKKELKDKVQAAFVEETPDLRQNILSACENESQFPAPAKSVKKSGLPVLRRIAAVAACAVLFVAGLFVGKFLPMAGNGLAETCVYLDVNPSVELTLDADNRVITCVAANEDAETVLNGMEFSGVELKTALNALVGSMYVKGYLTQDDNSMLISVDTSNKENTGVFLTYITKQVNEVFEKSAMECSIIAQGVKADATLKQRADEKGISVGKMHLIDKMIDGMSDLTEADRESLFDMSIKELNLIYATKPNEEENESHDELLSGSVGGYIDETAALNAVLGYIQKELGDVADYKVFALPSRFGEKKIVYEVTLKLFGEETVKKYEVDCLTGDVFYVGEENDRHEQPPYGEPPNEEPYPERE